MSKSGQFSRRRFIKLLGASAAAGAFVSTSDLMRVYAQGATGITFAGWGGVAEDEGVRAAIDVFHGQHANIRVRWQHVPDANEFGRVLLTNIAAGTAPDTAFILSDQYETLRQAGVLLDITDRIAADPLLGQPNYFIQPQESNRSANGNGRWHGIGSTWVAHHMYYNAALFDEAGTSPRVSTTAGSGIGIPSSR
jgi:multiple sugar transport system substrate-binding protein